MEKRLSIGISDNERAQKNRIALLG